jgi:hypothetical protein
MASASFAINFLVLVMSFSFVTEFEVILDFGVSPE